MHPLQIQRCYVGHIFYMMKWLWKWMANYPPWIDSTTHSKSDGCHFYYIYYCGRNQCVHWGCCQSQSWSAGDILKRSRSHWTFQKKGLCCIVDELSYIGWSECIDTLTIRPMVLSTTDTTTTLSIKQSFQTPDWSTETRLLLFQNAGNWSWAAYIAMPISSTHNMPGSWW